MALGAASLGAHNLHKFFKNSPKGLEAKSAYELADAEYQKELVATFRALYPDKYVGEEIPNSALNDLSRQLRNYDFENMSNTEQALFDRLNEVYGVPDTQVDDLYQIMSDAKDVFADIGSPWGLISAILIPATIVSIGWAVHTLAEENDPYYRKRGY